MIKRKLGNSDVFITPIGLGTNAVGGHNLYPGLDENEGKELVRTAINEGITFLDTAYIYGEGRSEELVGEVMSEFNRSDITLATKAAHVPGTRLKSNNPEFLIQSVEQALTRLKTDYIDLFYLHYPDDTTPKYEAVGTLERLREKGWIRSIGVSNFSEVQLIEANQDGYVDVVQDEYNLLHRGNEGTKMVYCQENNLSFIPYYPLASGLLTGKYTRERQFLETDLRSKNPDFKGERFKGLCEKMDHLKPLSRKYKTDVTNLVLAWYLQRNDVTGIIPGAKTSAQVRDNMGCLDVSMTLEDYQAMSELFR